MSSEPIETAEEGRLREADQDGSPVAAFRALPERAPVGDGARGLQPRRRRLELLQPRPGALARVPLGRGRDRGRQRRPAAPLLRARALERARPDPQGAVLRADQHRGQPRRGRQGVLLLPRQHADPLLHADALQVSAGGVPVRGPRRRRTAAGRDELEYELLDTGVFDEDRYFDVFVEYAKAAPEDLLVPDHGRQPRPRGGRRCTAADRLVPQHLGATTASRGRACAPTGPASSRPSAPGARRALVVHVSTPTPSCCSPRTRRTSTRLWGDAEPRRRYVKDGINDYVVAGAAEPSTPAQVGTKAAACTG